MSKLCLLVILCVGMPSISAQSYRHQNWKKDLGEPLFLTPLIKQGQITNARQAAEVPSRPFANQRSYSGFLTINQQYNSNTFFWYFPAKTNPESAPLVIWLNGGPGASSLVGLFAENGPLEFTARGNVELREYSWNKYFNLIYIDNPVGVGFSFTENDAGYAKYQEDVGRDLYEAIKQLYQLFPEFNKLPLYIGGTSYAGKFVVAIGYTIHNAQQNRSKTKGNQSTPINLSGLVIGGGFCDPINQLQLGQKIYSLGLIDEEGLKVFQKIEADIRVCIQRNDSACATANSKKLLKGSHEVSVFQNLTGFTTRYNSYKSRPYLENVPFVEFVQRPTTRKLIHVGKKTFKHMEPQSKMKEYFRNEFIQSVASWMAELLNHYRICVYVGQVDLATSYQTTVGYLQKLRFNGAENYKIAKRQVWRVDNQVAGYAKIGGNLVEVMVRNAGHLASIDQPKWTLDLVKRFIRVTDNSTYRGCTSELPTEIQLSESCEVSLCNNLIFPEERLLCHQCEGGDCLTVAAGSEVACALYEMDDECFIDVIDETEAVRGCLSDGYDDTMFRKTCKTSGCNDQPAVSTFSCIQCDSATDPNCKTGPNPGTDCSVPITNTCPMELLFGRIEHCFTYRNTERVVRGCSRDEPELVLQSEYVTECILEKCNDECIGPNQCYVCDSITNPSCIDETIANTPWQNCPLGTISCHTCRDAASTTYRGCGTYDGEAECSACWQDPGCNKKKMLRCYNCTSAENENCETWENIESIDQVICNGNCIATLRDDVVIRGCQRNNFDCQPSLTCKSCTEDDCNSGLVPDKRLRCHQCNEFDGSCNEDQSSMNPDACPEVEDENDKCYVFVTSDKKMVRGCTTDSRFMDCMLSPAGKCLTCTGDGCNSQPLIGTLTCLQCDSNVDDDCKEGIISGDDECIVGSAQFCETDVEFGEYEYCYTYRFGERVRRGCSKKDSDISSQIKYVRECRLDNCNNECIDSATCYTCDSKTNSNCANNTIAVGQVKCPIQQISCYSCRASDKTITRGCGAGDTSGQCFSCWDDEGCNLNPMPECYVCNSRIDKNCADWTDPGRINKNVCNGLCIAALRDGFVERGCQSNSFDCPASETCLRCNGDECNTGLIPANRIVCHQCDQTDPNCNSEKESASPTACDNYQANDQCFYFLDSNDNMVRGCASDDKYQECLQNNERCVTCELAGCNSNAATRTPSLECAKCSGEESCAWGQTVKSRCDRQIPYYSVESCYTYKSSDGTIRRGCTLDDNTCSSGNSDCQICSVGGCNDANRAFQRCLQCKGEDDSVCASGINVNGTECLRAFQPYDTRGCYAWHDGIGNITRGCLYDLSADDKENCNNNKDTCEICTADNCNTKDLRSHASSMSISSALLVAVIAYTLKA